MVGGKEDRQMILSVEGEVLEEREEGRWDTGSDRGMGLGDKRIEFLMVFTI